MDSNYKHWFSALFIEYRLKNISIYLDTNGEYYSYIPEREVHLPKNFRDNITEWGMFAFLHEIGHIMTNTTKMKRYQQEFLATQWAIDTAKELQFKISPETIDIYQQYILKWRETSIKLKAKNVATKRSLLLTV